MRKTLAFLSAAALLAAGVPAGSVIGTEALHEEETPVGVRTRGHYYYDKISDTESGRKVKAIYDYVDSYCEKLMQSGEDYHTDEFSVKMTAGSDPS